MRLKLKVIKRPDTDAIHRWLIAAIAREYASMGKWSKDRLENPVTGWQVGPSIYYKVAVNMKQWRLSLFHRSRTTGGQRYNWVRLGTRPHVIRPVNVSKLRFRMPHSPKTLAPGQAMPSGPAQTVFANLVNHPGIKPRDPSKGFPGYVYKLWFKNRAFADTFYRRTERAGRDALRFIW